MHPCRYDIDVKKTKVGLDPSIGPFLLVHYQHEDDREDTEVMTPDEMSSRLRFAAE